MSTAPDYVNLASVDAGWSDGLLILMYHSVAVPPVGNELRGLHVSSFRLRQQLRELAEAHATAVTTLDAWQREHPAGRQIILTFDDGFRNLLTNGLPILTALKLPAITYLVGGLIGKYNEWDANKDARREALMDRAQIREWLAAGMEIGAHTLTHPDLTTIPPAEAQREIVDCKKLLEDEFGRPVRHFCYPYGGCNEAVRAMVQEAGYETATTTIPKFNSPTTDLLALRRVMARHRKPYLAAWTGGYLG